MFLAQIWQQVCRAGGQPRAGGAETASVGILGMPRDSPGGCSTRSWILLLHPSALAQVWLLIPAKFTGSRSFPLSLLSPGCRRDGFGVAVGWLRPGSTGNSSRNSPADPRELAELPLPNPASPCRSPRDHVCVSRVGGLEFRGDKAQ